MTIDALFDGLERAGPGDAASLLRAIAIAGVPADAVMLDAGCGAGPDLATLRAARPRARIVAVDQSAPFVARVRAAYPVLAVHQADMTDPPGGPFDFIWSAGAVYIPGVVRCLDAWRNHLRPGGAVAFTHLCWRVADPAPAARVFWAAEGAVLGDAAALEAEVTGQGYRVQDAFWLGQEAWATYYDPLARRLDGLRQDELTQGFRAEIALWRAHGRDYGYRLIVAVQK